MDTLISNYVPVLSAIAQNQSKNIRDLSIVFGKKMNKNSVAALQNSL